MTGLTRCPVCGQEYKQIGIHWANSTDCDYPEITDEENDILRAVLLAGGTLTDQNGAALNPFVRYDTVSKAEAEWLTEQLGYLAVSPRQVTRDGVQYYRVKSRHHPDLTQLTHVMPVGGDTRTLPVGIDLSSTLARTLYVLVGALKPANHAIPRPAIQRSYIEDDAAIARAFDPFAPRVYEKYVLLGAVFKWFDHIGRDPVAHAGEKWLDFEDYEAIADTCPTCSTVVTDLSQHYARSDCTPLDAA